jgi:phosphoribosylformylglycinamidine synthase
VEFSPAPHFELDREFALQQSLLGLIRDGAIRSAHDLSEGGLFVALFESAAVRNLGFDASQAVPMRPDAYWFGEAQGRVVVSVSPEQAGALEGRMGKEGISCTRIGTVTSGLIQVDGREWGSVESWKERYDTAIERHMNAYHTE